MRILTNAYTLERVGGIEVNTLEVTRALAARGHDVHVVHGPPLADDPDFPNMREDFEAAGITLHGPQTFAPPSLATALPSAVGSLGTAKLAARLRPDVLWLQRFEHIIWGTVTALRSRSPLVCHLHHALSAGPLVPVAARGVKHFVAVSSFMRQNWIEAGLPGDRIEVVHNAIPEEQYPVGGDAERVRARAALGLPADVPIALFYGRLDQHKGLHLVLDAWQQAGAALGRAHLVLAGDFLADTDPSLRTRVADLIRAGSATLLPFQRNVVDLLHAADLVLFPSQLPESFGRVALEGLMTGRPVLATAVGGVPEILTGPLARFLVPKTDVAALAAGLTELVDWRRTEPGLGALCASEAAARFSFAGHVSSMEQILDRWRRPAR